MNKKSTQNRYTTPDDLMAIDEPMQWGTLPLHQLPEVRKLHRAEFNKTQPSLAVRAGRLAVGAAAGMTLMVSNPQIMLKTGDKLDAAFETGKGLNFLGRIATRILERGFKRSDEAKANRTKQVQETRAVATAKYRAAHPEIAAKEKELHNKWLQQEHEKRSREVFNGLVYRGDHTIDYFRLQNAYSFSKAIPRRSPERRPGTGFDGDYAELAKTALTDAASRRSKDGTIRLLGAQVQLERFQSKEDSGQSLEAVKQSEKLYVAGASSALWQLGFLNYEEDNIPYGRGTFNPDIEWGTIENSVTTARLAYDPDNELHALLMPPESAYDNPTIEVELGGRTSQYEPYMNLRVVEAMPAAAVARA